MISSLFPAQCGAEEWPPSPGYKLETRKTFLLSNLNLGFSSDFFRAYVDRMEDAGFYWIDFTRTYRDVLLINAKLAPLSLLDKIHLSIHKYRIGVPNKMRSYVHQVMQRTGH